VSAEHVGERAVQHDAFERDVDDAAALAERGAEGGERVGHADPQAGGDEQQMPPSCHPPRCALDHLLHADGEQDDDRLQHVHQLLGHALIDRQSAVGEAPKNNAASTTPTG
jgi:hypothetical protein